MDARKKIAGMHPRNVGAIHWEGNMPKNGMTQLFVILVSAPLIMGLGLFNNKTQKGEGGSEVSGSGGAAGAQGQSADLIRCAKPIGTAALLEPEHSMYTRYGLSSPVPLVKLMMAQSGCFRVVDRGAASAALQKERALAGDGELQKGSNMGGGQMAAADYIITPEIVHKDSDAGGGMGGLGGLLPGKIGAIAGGLKLKKLEAQVMLSVTNVRTSVQEAIATGSAKKSDIGFGGLGWIGGVAGGAGTYESTDIGKITAVAFLDAHNKLVTQLGAIPAGSANADHAGYVTSAQVNFRSGPSPNAPVIAPLYEGTSILPTGIKNGQWWEVEALGKTGWVHSDYITR